MACTARSATTKEGTNYARLCCLLIDVGYQALRDTFDRIHAPSSLHTILASPQVHSNLQGLFTDRKISPAQWVKLYPVIRSAVSSANFDMGLLLVLLKNVCGLTSQPAGWDAYPSDADNGCEADIIRVTCFSSTVYSYAEHAVVDDVTYHTLWQDIRKALVRLGGVRYGPAIDNLKTASMDPLIEEHYKEIFQQWQREDYIIKNRLDEMRNDIKHIKEQFKIMQMAVDSINNRGNKRNPSKGPSDYSETGSDLYSSKRPSPFGGASSHRELTQMQAEEMKAFDSTEDQSQSTAFELPSLEGSSETVAPMNERTVPAFRISDSLLKKNRHLGGTIASASKRDSSSQWASSCAVVAYCNHCMRQGQLICKNCLVTICKEGQEIFETNLCDSTKGKHVFQELEDKGNSKKTLEMAAMSSPEHTANGKDEKEWVCSRCTYLNSPEHGICVICGTTRDVDTVELSKAGGIVCQHCTLRNDAGAKVCVACHRTLYRCETII